MENKKFRVAPGEAVGTIAAQSIGEPGTQMVLRAFHQAGVISSIRTKGLPRLIELVDARKAPKVPFMEINLEKGLAKDFEKCADVKRKIEEVKVADLIESFEENLKNSVMHIQLSGEKMKAHDITEKMLLNALNKSEGVSATLDNHIITIKIEKKKETDKSIKGTRIKFVHIRNMTIAGVKGISRVGIEQNEDKSFYIIAMGNNIEGLLDIDGIDKSRIYSNDPFEVARVFGIEAARNLIVNELSETMKLNGVTVSMRHLALVADMMTYYGIIKSIGRHGIVGLKNSVLARAAYEETVKHFVNACVFSEKDQLNGVAENILIGKQINVGTGLVKLSIKKEDLKKIKQKPKKSEKE